MVGVSATLREHQQQDPTLGTFYSALYTFADRTVAHFFDGDLPDPVLSFERCNNVAEYHHGGGKLGLPDVIVINVWKLRTGAEAAESLAHELVHLWQQHHGVPHVPPYHNVMFIDQMEEMGIVANRSGIHQGFAGDTWSKWMLENEDLQLDQFMLPGMDAKPKRKLKVFQCSCGVRIRHRKTINVQCLDCNQPFKQVATRKDNNE